MIKTGWKAMLALLYTTAAYGGNDCIQEYYCYQNCSNYQDKHYNIISGYTIDINNNVVSCINSAGPKMNCSQLPPGDTPCSDYKSNTYVDPSVKSENGKYVCTVPNNKASAKNWVVEAIKGQKCLANPKARKVR